LADAYLGTRVERELRNVLKRGGLIAGSSAGASILASSLVRGDPAGPEVMMAKGHERGFGFIPNNAIDQHVSERHREHEMESVVAAHPKLLGIGIDPNTIMVVHGGRLDVIGSGKVTITEATVNLFTAESGVLLAAVRRVATARLSLSGRIQAITPDAVSARTM